MLSIVQIVTLLEFARTNLYVSVEFSHTCDGGRPAELRTIGLVFAVTPDEDVYVVTGVVVPAA
jgi:hypothetical protein